MTQKGFLAVKKAIWIISSEMEAKYRARFAGNDANRTRNIFASNFLLYLHVALGEIIFWIKFVAILC